METLWFKGWNISKVNAWIRAHERVCTYRVEINGGGTRVIYSNGDSFEMQIELFRDGTIMDVGMRINDELIMWSL